MIEDIDAYSSREAIQTLERFVPVDSLKYLDAQGEGRMCTTTEFELERIFADKQDQISRHCSRDGSVITETLLPGSFDHDYAPFVHRYLSPDGAFLGARLSGLYFLGRVTNDSIEIDSTGTTFEHRIGKSASDKILGSLRTYRLTHRIKSLR